MGKEIVSFDFPAVVLDVPAAVLDFPAAVTALCSCPNLVTARDPAVPVMQDSIQAAPSLH